MQGYELSEFESSEVFFGFSSPLISRIIFTHVSKNNACVFISIGDDRVTIKLQTCDVGVLRSS